MQLSYVYNAKVKEVLTGDSFTAIIDLGFGEQHETQLSLLGIQAPQAQIIVEDKTVDNPAAVASKKKLTELISKKNIVVEVRKLKDDEYAARVTVEGVTLPINEYMLRYGLAKMKR
jgi:hypothetical protein